MLPEELVEIIVLPMPLERVGLWLLLVGFLLIVGLSLWLVVSFCLGVAYPDQQDETLTNFRRIFRYLCLFEGWRLRTQMQNAAIAIFFVGFLGLKCLYFLAANFC